MFDESTVVLFMLGTNLAIALAAFFDGKRTGIKENREALLQAQAELDTVNAVRHNLNCLVGDLKHERDEKHLEVQRLDKLLHERNVKVLDLRNSIKVERAEVMKFKPAALAFNSLKGKWVTDNKNCVQHNTRKECFRCIGYPERRL